MNNSFKFYSEEPFPFDTHDNIKEYCKSKGMYYFLLNDNTYIASQSKFHLPSVDSFIIDEKLNEVVAYEETTYSPSGNAIFERLTKFVDLELRGDSIYNKIHKLYSYTKPWKVTSNNDIIGINLYLLLRCDINGISNLDKIPLYSFPELMKMKNEIKTIRGASTFLFQEFEDRIEISINLVKGKKKKHFQDCQVGLLCGILFLSSKEYPNKPIIIKNHGVDKDIIKKSSSKLFSITDRIDSDVYFECDGNKISRKRKLKPINHDFFNPKWDVDDYYKPAEGEKKYSIERYSKIKKDKNYYVIFANLAGTTRTKLITPDGEAQKIPSKVSIPDLVYIDETTHSIVIEEHKTDKNFKKGIKQAKNLQKFTDIIRSVYPSYKIFTYVKSPNNSILI